ncbi:MAG: hypothetical protein IKR37_04485 [Paludibacteraceae bacterium]|nr:hypothetical protein [Paludibacteraceae bacterium]
MRVSQEIVINPISVMLNGQPVATNEQGEKMLVELYRRYVKDYPKFFKMDTLSRLGFIAAELVLQDQRVEAVILANRSASIKNDTDYLATITGENYYPSPALFVYTLPNIVTGEIAIRHHIQGETSCYILENPEQLEPIILSQITRQSPILAGWCECSGPNTFNAKLQIIWNN